MTDTFAAQQVVHAAEALTAAAATATAAAQAEPQIEPRTVLSLDGVTKTYPNGVQALKDISFEVKEGEFVVVIGPSGSGKSTMLRSINRLVQPTTGEITVDGEEISRAKGKRLRLVRRKVAMVFQHYNLVYRLSVLQNVLHGRLGYMSGLRGMLGRYSEADKRAAVDLLDEIELGPFVYNRASELSGGQKQRVGIARAIMQDPKILLCDEPIASLDPSVSKVIMDMIFTMATRRKITCVVNLHQIDVALKYATRIIGLHQGELVFDGPPSELDNATIEKIYNTSVENLMISEELKNAA